MSGPALVAASGHTFWSDYWAINQPDVPTFAVNGMLIVLADAHRRVDHVVSAHLFKLQLWVKLYGLAGIQAHSTVSAPEAGITGWPKLRAGGSSSLLAVRIARALGHDPVYVAGVPLDAGGHIWSDPSAPRQKNYERYTRAWIDLRGDLAGHVWSPRGFLHDLLGPLCEPGSPAVPSLQATRQVGIR